MVVSFVRWQVLTCKALSDADLLGVRALIDGTEDESALCLSTEGDFRRTEISQSAGNELQKFVVVVFFPFF